MGVILNGAQTLLPRQGALYAKPWSLERENQERQIIGSGLHALVPAGWLTPAVLVISTGHAVKIATGNILWVGGVAYQLTSDLICNDTTVNATNTIWATIIPTRANQNTRTALDTYAPQLTSTVTGNPPAAGAMPADAYARCGVVVIDSGGTITSITQQMADARITTQSGAAGGVVNDGVPAGTTVTIAAGQAALMLSGAAINGTLVNNGRVKMLDWP